MRKSLCLLVLTCGLLGATLIPSVWAATPTTFSFNDYLTLCSGETIHLTGHYQVVSDVTVDANGVSHVHSSFIWGRNITGVSSEGVTYYLVGGVHEAYNEFGPAGNDTLSPLTQTITFNLISQDGGAHLQYVATAHWTLTPNGDWVVNFDRFRSRCVG
jgi:hypothetical protein